VNNSKERLAALNNGLRQVSPGPDFSKSTLNVSLRRQITPGEGSVASNRDSSVGKTHPGVPYITGLKQLIQKNGSNEFLKNFSHHKSNSFKKVFIRPKVARLYNSNSPKKSHSSLAAALPPKTVALVEANQHTPTNNRVSQVVPNQTQQKSSQSVTESEPSRARKKVIPLKNLKFSAYKNATPLAALELQ